MARPEKCKRICNLPLNHTFRCVDTPDSGTDSRNHQLLSLEEFETIRLIDYVGLTQEQCASQMNVARTTVQRLYTDARKKIAAFFILGSALDIEGGNYKVCENSDRCCQKYDCAGLNCGSMCHLTDTPDCEICPVITG